MAEKNTTTVQLPKGFTIENTQVGEILLADYEFSTGSKGYFVGGLKIVGPGGKRYQTQMQMVEIGSNPNKTKKAKGGKGKAAAAADATTK